MRILHLLAEKRLPRDPDREGVSGVVRVALEIARAQVGLGQQATVATVGRATQREEWNWQGVRLVTLPVMPWAKVWVNGRTFDLRQHLPFVLYTRQHQFDVVQGHIYTYMRFLRAGLRVVHFHSDPFYPGGENEGFDLKPGDFANILAHSQARVAVSRFVAGQLERGFRDRGGVEVIYNGVDQGRFDSARWTDRARELRAEWGADGQVVFLFSGAVVPEKGVIHLARTFRRLAAERDDVKLVLAGSSGLWGGLLPNAFHRVYESEVQAELAPLVAAGRVRFLGKVATTDMPAIYAASDVVVIPSVWNEAFPLVAPEALAAGRPIVASQAGGLVEVVDQEVGQTVPPGDEAALGAALAGLANDPERRARLSRNARLRARAFRWEHAAERLDAIYRQQLERRVRQAS
jgi:glycosyltransferase involved in cell wall biosynthesis